MGRRLIEYTRYNSTLDSSVKAKIVRTSHGAEDKSFSDSMPYETCITSEL